MSASISERIFGDEANQDRRPEPIDGECPDRCAEDQADVSVDFRLRANRRNPCLECDIAHADQTTKRLAALAVPLVMLVYQTQSRRIAVATRDSES